MKDLEKYLVGRRCGIVQTLGKAAIDFDDPSIYAYGAKICDTVAFSEVTASKKCGGGGIDEQEAKNCCLGEAVERYCAGVWSVKDIVWATAKELQEDVFPLEQLTLFSHKQYNQYNFPYLSPSSTIQIPWIEVVCSHDQKLLWAPAAFFLLPSPQHKNQISPPISTGLACHRSFKEAYNRGLCECIERDAVSLMWLRGVIPPKVVNITKENRVAQILKTFSGEVTVGDLTSDQGIPTYFCLMEGNSPCGNIISFGAACDGNSDDALYRAVREASLGRVYVKRLLKSSRSWKVGYRFQNVDTFDRHACFYSSHPKYYDKLTFLKSGKTVSYASSCVDVSINLPTYTRDLTSPEIKKLGLHVIKTWVPGLMPLHGHHLLPFLGHKRLRFVENIFPHQFLYKKGHNPWPHPMP